MRFCLFASNRQNNIGQKRIIKGELMLQKNGEVAHIEYL